MMEVTGSRFILAADGIALSGCHELSPIASGLFAIKIHDQYDYWGPRCIEQLRTFGFERVWVDLKLHDIPKTVGLRAAVLFNAGAHIITVHASGGIEMIRAALAARTNQHQKVYAVTVLTSLPAEEVLHIYGDNPWHTVRRLAKLAKKAGVQGIVCSPEEVSALASDPELEGLELICPGVRSIGISTHDQARVGTPTAAIRSGATRLVIGRQITEAEDRIAAFKALEEEVATALLPELNTLPSTENS